MDSMLGVLFISHFDRNLNREFKPGSDINFSVIMEELTKISFLCNSVICLNTTPSTPGRKFHPSPPSLLTCSSQWNVHDE